MIKLIFIGTGGFLGAIARYLLSGIIQRIPNTTFPLGTLTVNILGCLIMGILAGLIEDRPFLSPNARLFFIIGLLGSFTTFSAFGFETSELFHDGKLGWAFWNIIGNVFLCIIAVIGGRLLMKVVYS